MITTCSHKYEDGHVCGDAAVARERCSRHYAQARRGRLGKTREIERGVVMPTVTVTLNAETLAKLDKRAKSSKVSRSQTVEEILSAALG